jgi:hypothetical protein
MGFDSRRKKTEESNVKEKKKGEVKCTLSLHLPLTIAVGK